MCIRDSVEGLAKQNLKTLKKGKKNIKRLEGEIENLRENIFYFIKNLEEPSLSASNFYIVLLSYIEDIAGDLDYIISKSYKHMDNDHEKLKLSQIRDLQKTVKYFCFIILGLLFCIGLLTFKTWGI